MKTVSSRFTLTEALIAFSVILVVLSLLAPGLVSAVEHARRIQCAKHLEQKYASAMMYADDHHDLIPGGHFESNASQFRWKLAPYMGFSISATNDPDPQSVYDKGPGHELYCPAAWKDALFATPANNYWIHPWSYHIGTYGVNLVFMAKNWHVYNELGVRRFSQVRRAEGIILFGDLSDRYVSFYPGHAMKTLALYHYGIDYRILGPGGRHSGRNNSIFIDGHLQQFLEIDIYGGAFPFPGKYYLPKQ